MPDSDVVAANDIADALFKATCTCRGRLTCEADCPANDNYQVAPVKLLQNLQAAGFAIVRAGYGHTNGGAE